MPETLSYDELAYKLGVLEQENEHFKNKIEGLEGILYEENSLNFFQVVLGMTATESTLINLLWKSRNFCRREHLHFTLYNHRLDSDNIPDIKIIDVLIHKIRAKLKNLPESIEVKTVRAIGYYMDAKSCEALTEILKPYMAEKD
jgi:DNA-binding response OmpR family regulator